MSINHRAKAADTRQPRTWALPEEPEVGTRLVESSGHVFERQDDGWHAWLPASSRRWSAVPFMWSELFTDGPLREATREDLAAAGIEERPDPLPGLPEAPGLPEIRDHLAALRRAGWVPKEER